MELMELRMTSTSVAKAPPAVFDERDAGRKQV